MRLGRLGWMCGIAVAALSGCGPTIHPTFDSPEPAARNAAIVRATAAKDLSAVPDLVRMLASDDPATRLLAITGLERLTGQTLGYDYGGTELDRAEAIDRWEAWLASHHEGGSVR